MAAAQWESVISID